MSAEALRFFDDLLSERLAHLHTCMPARVVRFDALAMTADVQPLFMRRFEGRPAEALPLLLGLPVLRRKVDAGGLVQVDSPVLEPGDIVVVLFAERALDRAMISDEPADPEHGRRHALEDGIILGLLR